MVARRLTSLLKNRVGPVSTPAAGGEKEGQSWGRKIVSGALISLTGGVALSALNDLLIFYGCSSKAMEKASKNQAIVEAIGEPIVRGPWYNASLGVNHKRQSVSCSFPASGPQGTVMFQLKAVRNGGESWFSYLWPRDWEILIMEALLHVPANEKHNQTFRISVSDDSPPPPCKACTAACGPQQPVESVEKTRSQPVASAS
ncbi:mitochondrial import inner membrane translocase [Striga asiatica]|uniref:Mitochondrial import inner membrane translocase n=1 Tax=Striga asiatica TaxID=4170 RepID=A0A5A7RJ20_STRAF|nr:mitochondrial import inner membrane translocase [Striga asiatica]